MNKLFPTNFLFIDITLQIVGASKTKWSKGLGLQFRGKEEYFDTMVFLARPTEEDQFTLDAGTHYFDFECEIPENCPTSFESKHGRIRYTLAVVVSRPGKPSQTHKSAFTVLNVLDLNTFTPSVLVSFFFIHHYTNELFAPEDIFVIRLRKRSFRIEITWIFV